MVVGLAKALKPVVEELCGKWPEGACDLDDPERTLIYKMSHINKAIPALLEFARRTLPQCTDVNERRILTEVLEKVPEVNTPEWAAFKQLLSDKARQMEEDSNGGLFNSKKQANIFKRQVGALIKTIKKSTLESAQVRHPRVRNLLLALEAPDLMTEFEAAVDETSQEVLDEFLDESTDEPPPLPSGELVEYRGSHRSLGAPGGSYRSLGAPKRTRAPNPPERLLACLRNLGKEGSAKGAPLGPACEALREALESMALEPIA